MLLPQMQLYHIAGSTVDHSGDLLFYGQDKFIRKINRTIVVQSLTNPQDYVILRGHTSAVSHLALHGKMLLSSEIGYDSDVILWDLESYEIVYRFSEHDGGVVSADFSADGLFYVTCGKNGRLFVVEVASGDIVTMGESEPLVQLYFGDRVRDPRGRRLALWHLLGVTEQGTISHMLFDPKYAKLHQTIINTQSYRKQVIDVCFAKNDTSLALAVCTSGEILVVDLTSEEVLTMVQLPGALGRCNSIACLTEVPEEPVQRSIYATYERAESLDEVIAVGGSEFVAVLRGQAQNWDISGVHRVQGDCRCIDGASGRILAGLAEGQTLLIILSNDRNEFQIVPISDQNTGAVTDMVFLDSSVVALSATDRRIRIFDLKDCLSALVIDTTVRGNLATPIYPTRLFANDVQLLAGFNCGDLHVYDVENGDLLAELPTADRAAISALYAQENIICTGGAQGDVRVWDVRGAKLLYSQREHTGRVTQLYYNAYYNGITSFSTDRYAISTLAGKRAAQFMAEGPINAAAIVKNGYAIAENRKIALLDLRRNYELFSYLFEQKVTAIASDGECTVFAGFEDGTVRVLAIGGNGFEILDEAPQAHSGTVTSIAAAGSEIATADSTGEVMFWAHGEAK